MAGGHKKIVKSTALVALIIVLIALFYWKRIWNWYLELHWKQIGLVAIGSLNCNSERPLSTRDGIHFLDHLGNELFFLEGLNNKITLGSRHTIAFDHNLFRIYYYFSSDRIITALNSIGNVLFRVENISVDSFVIDPKTGNLFCLFGADPKNGLTIVIDPNGQQVGSYKIAGSDLVYDSHEDAFWAVGYEIIKFDRDGKHSVQISNSNWESIGITNDPRDGGVWIAQLNRDKFPSIESRLVRLGTQGNLEREIRLGDRYPHSLTCDPRSGTVWIVEFEKALLRIPIQSEVLDTMNFPAKALTISKMIGIIWVATKNEIIKMNLEGEIIDKYQNNLVKLDVRLAAP